MLSNGRRAGDELAVRARLPSSVEETSMRLSNDQENDSAFKADMVMAAQARVFSGAWMGPFCWFALSQTLSRDVDREWSHACQPRTGDFAREPQMLWM